jgi:hypothetical protein
MRVPFLAEKCVRRRTTTKLTRSTKKLRLKETNRHDPEKSKQSGVVTPLRAEERENGCHDD